MQALARNRGATTAQQETVAADAEARALIEGAATTEGLDLEFIEQHLDPADWLAYSTRDLSDLRQPEVAAAVVRGIVAAAESGRCTCDRCRRARA